jgi:hypothetical protein
MKQAKLTFTLASFLGASPDVLKRHSKSNGALTRARCTATHSDLTDSLINSPAKGHNKSQAAIAVIRVS